MDKVQKPGNLRCITLVSELFRIVLNNFNYRCILSYFLIFLSPISVPEMHIVWMVRALYLSSVLNTLKCTMTTFLSLSLQFLQTALPEFLGSEKKVGNRMSTQVKKLLKVLKQCKHSVPLFS